jgi:hypothetical protein
VAKLNAVNEKIAKEKADTLAKETAAKLAKEKFDNSYAGKLAKATAEKKENEQKLVNQADQVA